MYFSMISYVSTNGKLALTVDRVVANSVSDILHDTTPSDLLYVLSMGDNETDIVIVVIITPAVNQISDTNMLRRTENGEEARE